MAFPWAILPSIIGAFGGLFGGGGGPKVPRQMQQMYQTLGDYLMGQGFGLGQGFAPAEMTAWQNQFDAQNQAAYQQALSNLGQQFQQRGLMDSGLYGGSMADLAEQRMQQQNEFQWNLALANEELKRQQQQQQMQNALGYLGKTQSYQQQLAEQQAQRNELYSGIFGDLFENIGYLTGAPRPAAPAAPAPAGPAAPPWIYQGEPPQTPGIVPSEGVYPMFGGAAPAAPGIRTATSQRATPNTAYPATPSMGSFYREGPTLTDDFRRKTKFSSPRYGVTDVM